MKFALLPNRSLIEVSGEDAENFLENLVTCKTTDLENSEARFGALLTPQGKIMFDFFLIKIQAGFLIDIIDELQPEFLKRMMFYRLRAKVTIEAKLLANLFACWDCEKPADSLVVTDPRHEQMGYRVYDGIKPDGSQADYTSFRITNCMPEGGMDFEYGNAYPHETLMDQYSGVDFKKGCYVGQEVVSRMQHRGTVKKRIVQVSSEDELPQTGAIITADGKPAGTLGSVVSNHGLAMLRLDRVAKADTIMAGDTAIKASIQNSEDFTLPEAG